jgi:hypothetical protein
MIPPAPAQSEDCGYINSEIIKGKSRIVSLPRPRSLKTAATLKLI